METAPLDLGTMPGTADGAPANPEKPGTDKIGALVSDLAQQHGAGQPVVADVPKRPRGRPALHGRYSKANGSDGKNPVPESVVSVPMDGNEAVALPEPDKPRVRMPDGVLKRCLKNLLGTVDAWRVNRRLAKAAKLGLAKEIAEPLAESARLDEGTKDSVAELIPLAFSEWGIDPNVSPTAALIVLASTQLLAEFDSNRTMEKLAKEKR